MRPVSKADSLAVRRSRDLVQRPLRERVRMRRQEAPVRSTEAPRPLSAHSRPEEAPPSAAPGPLSSIPPSLPPSPLAHPPQTFFRMSVPAAPAGSHAAARVLAAGQFGAVVSILKALGSCPCPTQLLSRLKIASQKRWAWQRSKKSGSRRASFLPSSTSWAAPPRLASTKKDTFSVLSLCWGGGSRFERFVTTVEEHARCRYARCLGGSLACAF